MILPFLLLVLSIVSFTIAVTWLNKYVMKDAKTPADCYQPKYCAGDPKCCMIWDKNMCRKGQIDGNGNCASKGSAGPLLLAILGVGFLIGFIVTLIRSLKK